jgi:hypothetical protein
LERARQAVARLPMRWNLGTKTFTGVVVEFSTDRKRWEQRPQSGAGLAYARVTASDNQVEITFLRAVGGPAVFTVPAHSVAAARPVRLVE